MASNEIGISVGVDSTVEKFEFNEAELAEVQKHLDKYPDPKSAVMPVLWMAQNKYGWLSSGALELVANTLKLSYAHVLRRGNLLHHVLQEAGTQVCL